jgi:hypothetical protein
MAPFIVIEVSMRLKDVTLKKAVFFDLIVAHLPKKSVAVHGNGRFLTTIEECSTGRNLS